MATPDSHPEALPLPALGATPAAASQPTRITCIDYGPDRVETREVSDLPAFLAQHRPGWCNVRWINVDGLADQGAIHALADKYRLHPLAVEDLSHVGQRPKVEAYPGSEQYQARLFILVRMIQARGARLHDEQVCIFLGHHTVLTFQEAPGDVWQPIRQRLQTAGSRLRTNDASFLVYALVDAVIDQCFPILEHYGDRLEDLEDRVLAQPGRRTIHHIHQIKRELLLLRRAIWPLREVVNTLCREPHECLSDTTRTYLRDVYDHTIQVIDILETYREVASGLTETYMTSMSNHLNEIMKVLTIIGTIFIPLTFLAGVYGMNFHDMPELSQAWAYPMFWVICLVMAGGMILWFKRRGWL